MVFVADKIPTELQRIVEFLNVQMDPAQVLAVEVRQYVGQDQRAMVPRVLGQTAEAQQKKGSASQPGRQWDEPTFFQALEDRNGPEVTAAGRRIYQWIRDRALGLTWGKGRVYGTFYPVVEHGGQQLRPIGVFTDGKVEVQFGSMRSSPPFDDEAKRRQLCERLTQIVGVGVSPDSLAGWPKFPLSALTDDAHMQHFLNTLDWFVKEVRAS